MSEDIADCQLLIKRQPPGKGKRRSQIRFGKTGNPQVEIEIMESLIKDVRYGARSLLKRPGFTAIAVITLALGIGANTAIFSVVNAVLLRPLPYAEAEQLFVPWGSRTDLQDRTNVSYPDFVDWQAQTRILERVAAYNSSGALLREGDADPEPISGAAVSADLFPLLKVAPILG